MVAEPVFGTPLAAGGERGDWVAPSPGESQAYAGIGVRVDHRMQPLDAAGGVFANGLFAAGGVVAGPDRTVSGCRQGIDLATAYCAIDGMFG
jgi:glycerol-3-phosphate dehydrogenase subunit B